MKQNNFSWAKILFTLLFSIIFVSGYGQYNKRYFNAAYFELGGTGLMASFNYERQLLKSTRINGRIGLGIYGIRKLKPSIPFGLNYLLPIKKSKYFFALGAGLTYTKADVKLYIIADRRHNNTIRYSYFNFIPHVGLRHQSSKNILYQLNFTPVFNYYDGIPFIGFYIGKLF